MQAMPKGAGKSKHQIDIRQWADCWGSPEANTLSAFHLYAGRDTRAHWHCCITHLLIWSPQWPAACRFSHCAPAGGWVGGAQLHFRGRYLDLMLALLSVPPACSSSRPPGCFATIHSVKHNPWRHLRPAASLSAIQFTHSTRATLYSSTAQI